MSKGITTAQAQELIKQHGQNIIASHTTRTFLQKLFEQFNNFLIYILLAAAIISLAIGEVVDGALILTIVVLNGLFGLYQEQKAEGELEKLSAMTITTVRVIRDGKEIQIDSRELVPGDYVFIEEGTKIPADGVLEESINLEINEASLTGESYPVVKAVGDQIFGGTVASRGRGFFLVKNTGMNTKFGEIARELSNVTKEKTPLQKKLLSITKVIGYVGVALAIVVFVLAYVQGEGYFPSFLLAVSLAVAVVPEGLPAVMTITLAIGVGAMAKRKSIVRRLSAIESLGSVTLIATDKTGTLTTNKMNVKEIFVENSNLPAPSHGKGSESQALSKSKAFDLLVLDGVLCSTASLMPVHGSNRYDVLGDPTEGALLLLAKDLGIDPEETKKSWKLVEEVPFDSTTKMMTVMVQKNAKHVVFSKGAPESILSVSTKLLEGGKEIAFTSAKKKSIEKVVEGWAKQGLRVIAFSYKEGSATKKTLNKDMVFIGLVAIHDAPRPEARDAIRVAHDAGIKVVMITGDNEKTAEAIGVATGLLEPGDEIMTGHQIEEFDDKELMKHLKRVKAFARTTPLHKNRIVQLYQRLGEIVAVTGDGVNDAIALKQADVGVAMGLVGTDVARETADMVVTDDNFASIVAAIEEGRHIIQNLKNALKYLLASNTAEAIALIISLVAGIPHLFYPIQFLYVNLIGDGLPALALAFSPRESAIMKQKPTRLTTILGRFDYLYVGAVGAVTSILILFSYFFFQSFNESIARTAAFSTLALTQAFIFTDLWLSHRPVVKNIPLFKSKLFFAAFALSFILQWFIVSNESAAKLFKITPIDSMTFGWFVFIAFLVIPGIAIMKKLLPK